MSSKKSSFWRFFCSLSFPFRFLLLWLLFLFLFVQTFYLNVKSLNTMLFLFAPNLPKKCTYFDQPFWPHIPLNYQNRYRSFIKWRQLLLETIWLRTYTHNDTSVGCLTNFPKRGKKSLKSNLTPEIKQTDGKNIKRNLGPPKR